MKILQSARMAFWRLGWRLRSYKASGLQVGEIFPDFSLRDLAGKVHRLTDPSMARYTVLWFTNFCEDCRGRIPLLRELCHQEGDAVRILVVSILAINDLLPQQVSSSCSFPILLDPEDVVGLKLGLAHPPNACPFHNLFIVSHSGRIVFRHHLSALAPEKFRSLWRELLCKEQTA